MQIGEASDPDPASLFDNGQLRVTNGAKDPLVSSTVSNALRETTSSTSANARNARNTPHDSNDAKISTHTPQATHTTETTINSAETGPANQPKEALRPCRLQVSDAKARAVLETRRLFHVHRRRLHETSQGSQRVLVTRRRHTVSYARV